MSGAAGHGLGRAQGWATALLSLPATLALSAALAALLPLGTANAIFTAGLASPVVWVGCLLRGVLVRGAARAAGELAALALGGAAIVAVRLAGWL
jgi:hypothetical protein